MVKNNGADFLEIDIDNIILVEFERNEELDYILGYRGYIEPAIIQKGFLAKFSFIDSGLKGIKIDVKAIRSLNAEYVGIQEKGNVNCVNTVDITLIVESSDLSSLDVVTSEVKNKILEECASKILEHYNEKYRLNEDEIIKIV